VRVSSEALNAIFERRERRRARERVWKSVAVAVPVLVLVHACWRC
jgi:hypothetical protein